MTSALVILFPLPDGFISSESIFSSANIFLAAGPILFVDCLFLTGFVSVFFSGSFLSSTLSLVFYLDFEDSPDSSNSPITSAL